MTHYTPVQWKELKDKERFERQKSRLIATGDGLCQFFQFSALAWNSSFSCYWGA